MKKPVNRDLLYGFCIMVSFLLGAGIGAAIRGECPDYSNVKPLFEKLEDIRVVCNVCKHEGPIKHQRSVLRKIPRDPISGLRGNVASYSNRKV